MWGEVSRVLVSEEVVEMKERVWEIDTWTNAIRKLQRWNEVGWKCLWSKHGLGAHESPWAWEQVIEEGESRHKTRV